MKLRTATVLFVEDELFLLEEFTRVLQRKGYHVLSTSSPEDALQTIGSEATIDLLICDLQLPMSGTATFGLEETGGGRHVGLVLATEFRRRFRRSPIVLWTRAYSRELRQRATALGGLRIIPKSSGAEPVLDFLAESLDGFPSGARPRSLLVHGHDHRTLQEVKAFFQTSLRFPEPIVLRDEPTYGSTIIEKIEAYAASVDLVFVLLTPDDQVVGGADEAPLRRARQNVIFEMGYFMGMLGRQTGRVILLYRHPVELPSDISGMILVEISDGIESARPQLVQELREWI